jgi:hypothetical protein
MVIGMLEKVNRGMGTISPIIQKVTEAVGEWAEVWVGCFVGIRAKEESVAESAKAAKVINCKGHEMDVVSDKIGKDICHGAADCKLLLLVLVVLGRSGNRCRGSTGSTRRRRRDSDINCQERGSMWRLMWKVGWGEVHAHISGAFVEVGQG